MIDFLATWAHFSALGFGAVFGVATLIALCDPRLHFRADHDRG